MRLVFTSICVVISMAISAQNSLFDDLTAIKQDYPTHKVDFFQPVEATTEGMREIKAFQRFSYQPDFASYAMTDEVSVIEMDLPLQGVTYNLKLIPSRVVSSDFTVVDANNRPVDVTLGDFYWGIVNNDPNSIAAISFFENEVIGVFSTPEQGNFVLGKSELQSETENEHIFYAEKDLTVTPTISCDMDASDFMHEELPDWSQSISAVVDECKNIGIYFEADNQLYRDKNRSTSEVTNYITGLYNVVALLYDREDINTDINKLKIWTTNDPYRKDNSANCLNDFRDEVGNNFDGDLAHLLTTSRTNIGGRAFLTRLCQNRNRAAISNISNSYRTFPSYSWTIEVVAHEMGHNLGSPHTHNCSWGPSRNQALDNCRATEGSCVPGPPATGGGTIMSYCHLTSFGINLTKGFGDEPGDLIRRFVANAACLGGAFEAEAKTQDPTTVYLGDSVTLKATPIGVQYDHQWFRNGKAIINATSSTLVVKESGSYLCQVTTNCYEETNTINVDVQDFIVSLKCKAIEGEEVVNEFVTDTFFMDTQEEEYTVDVPTSIRNNYPLNASNATVELYACVGQYGVSDLRNATIVFTPPTSSGITDRSFTGHRLSQPRGVLCNDDDLGDFNPIGEWTFLLSDLNDNVPNGPESFVQFTIRQKWTSAPTPSDCNTFICDGGMVELDAGYDGLEYDWSTGEKTRKIIVTQPGVYKVTVRNGNIERSDEIEVVIAPESFSIDTSICNNAFFMLGNQPINETGEYRDTFQSSYGCDSVLVLSLEVKPVNEVVNDTFLCYLDTLNGVPYNTSVYDTETFTGADGCDSLYSTVIDVNPEIKLSFNVTRGCEDKGGVIEANASGGSGTLQYAWSTNDMGAVLNGAKSGLTRCTVTDSKGCTFERAVSITNFDSVGVEIEQTNNICFGDSTGTAIATTISGRQPFDFEWSTGSVEEEIQDLGEGDYGLTVTDRNDCSKEIVVMIEENPEINAAPLVVNANSGASDGSIDLNPQGGVPPYTYSWADGPTSEDRNGLPVGTYSVTIKDSEDCVNTIEVDVDMATAISDLEDVSIFEIYPNPSDSEVIIHWELDQNKTVQWQITGLDGHVVLDKKAQGKSFIERLNIGNYPSGVYVLRLITDQGSASQLFIKK